MIEVTGSLNLTQTPPEDRPNDTVVPLIGGKMDKEELQANFNALLYLLTEQMAVFLKTIDMLVEKEIITPEEANDKVLAVTGSKEELTETYNQIFTRFVGYYSSLRQMMEDGQIFKEGEGNAKTSNS